MKKSIVVAAMALGVILAAGVANAQQHVFYLAPGERVDYAGAVDDWTGSMAQRQIESTRSMITGPLRDLNRHLEASSGRPDRYYGSGVSPTSSPYRLGAYAYDGGNYGYNTYGYENRGYDRGYRRSSGYSNGRYDSRSRNRGYDNRRGGYSRPATQADVRGWTGAAIGVTALGTIISEVRADRRDERAERRHEEEMAELRAQREQGEYESETPRRSESRAYYNSDLVRPSRPAQYTVINGLGTDVCVNKTLLNALNGNRTFVSDPENIEIAPPPGQTICAAEAEFISADTILVTCKKGR